MRKFLITLTVVLSGLLSFGQSRDSITTKKNANDTLKLQILYFQRFYSGYGSVF